ncbi:MAG: DUF4290 domain-containing protein, partial [Tannerella sp.]|nr:DUF4290 domain-containing protein [Tannerella sp.]
IIYRHYGQTLERLIDKAAQMDDGDEKEALVHLIANQMKKSFLIWNKDSVDNQKILKDLAELSEMRIVRKAGTFRLVETVDLMDSPSRNSNNKKNKKNHLRKSS